MNTEHEAALAAIHNRDPDQLAAAFPDVESATRFRDEVLPELEPADCRWFWRQTFDAQQFASISSMVVDVAAAVAKTEGFTLGRDYSVSIDEDGLSQLICTPAVLTRVMAKLPPERKSVLKALVRSIPG